MAIVWRYRRRVFRAARKLGLSRGLAGSWGVLALCAGILLAADAAGTVAAQSAPAMTEAEMLGYLVQSGCVDGDGRLTDRLPIDTDCLERFYYARGFGKLRWEAWVTDAAKAPQAEGLARSGRCA